MRPKEEQKQITIADYEAVAEASMGMRNKLGKATDPITRLLEVEWEIGAGRARPHDLSVLEDQVGIHL